MHWFCTWYSGHDSYRTSTLYAVPYAIGNRLADGLDGAIARHTQLSDFGDFLDIVADFTIYSGIVFAFSISQSHYLWYALNTDL